MQSRCPGTLLPPPNPKKTSARHYFQHISRTMCLVCVSGSLTPCSRAIFTRLLWCSLVFYCEIFRDIIGDMWICLFSSPAVLTACSLNSRMRCVVFYGNLFVSSLLGATHPSAVIHISIWDDQRLTNFFFSNLSSLKI